MTGNRAGVTEEVTRFWFSVAVIDSRDVDVAVDSLWFGLFSVLPESLHRLSSEHLGRSTPLTFSCHTPSMLKRKRNECDDSQQPSKRLRQHFKDELTVLSDELVLKILTQLSVRDLAVTQR